MSQHDDLDHALRKMSTQYIDAAAERLDALIMGRLVELRGPSGKCYGELDVTTGVIIFRRGKIAERIDLTPYFKAVKGEK